MNGILFLFIIAAVVLFSIIAAAIVIALTVSRSKTRNYDEINTLKAIANTLVLSNNEVRDELLELKEKVNSIEKLLKEVE